MPATRPAAPSITKTKKHGVWTTSFKMVRSTAAINANCLKKAKAKVSIKAKGEVEEMKVVVEGLPKRTEFDFFVLQGPDFPFGLSWYQGDLKTDKYGKGDVTYRRSVQQGDLQHRSRQHRRPEPARRRRQHEPGRSTRSTSGTRASGSTTRPTPTRPVATRRSHRSTATTTPAPRP